ncbi:hypothetical protein [Proteiniphilum acetatigenes]|uniref:hypothetical protein n=1 Tax=Proteiniphilum acetatigenes TaxID=294710 RepID=UPI0003724115|nr:hypothetical protein [Proteiniphilum acetatigenes]
MEERQLNEKESLELITRMIQNTQRKLEKGNGMPFLVWGYTTIVVSLLVWYFLSTTGDYRMHYLWFLIPVIAGPMMFILLRKNEKGVKTYIDRVVGYVWIVMGVTGFMISITAMFFWNFPILFITILLMGSGTAITGLVIRFIPIAVAGFAGIVLSLACLFTQGTDQILVFAGLFLVMMVIPGHILYAKGRR